MPFIIVLAFSIAVFMEWAITWWRSASSLMVSLAPRALYRGLDTGKQARSYANDHM